MSTDDKLNLSEEIEQFATYLNGIRKPTVIAVNGGWGQGKTFFLNLLADHLKSKRHAVIRFDAWKNDFSPEPLISLIAEMDNQLRSQFKQIHDELNAKEWGDLLSLIGRTADSFAQASFEPTFQLTARAISLVGRFKKGKNAMERFRGAFERLVTFLTNHQNADGTKTYQLPLIVIVDELDRCRPTYAIELLERIKHFFDIPGVVFVLGVDMVQMGHSMKTVYGTEMDTAGYLRRFIDLQFELPQKPKNAMIEGFIQDSYHLCSIENRKILIESMLFFSNQFELRPRDIQKAIFQADAIFGIWNTDKKGLPHALASLVITTKNANRSQVFEKISRGPLKELGNLIPTGKAFTEQISDKETCEHIFILLNVGYIPKSEDAKRRSEYRQSRGYSNSDSFYKLIYANAYKLDLYNVEQFMNSGEYAETLNIAEKLLSLSSFISVSA